MLWNTKIDGSSCIEHNFPELYSAYIKLIIKSQFGFAC